MSTPTINELLQAAEEIRLETDTNANTAERVGEAIKLVAEYIDAHDPADLEGDIETAEGDISSLQTRMTAAEGDIDAVEATLDAADSTPTANSEHLVKSGGVYSALQDVLARVDEIEGVTVRTLSQRAVYRQNYITKTWTMETGGQYSVVATYTVEGAYKVHIKGRSFNSSTHPGTCDYVFKDESGTILGYEEHEGEAEGYDKVVDVPAGATRMAISATNASNTDYPAFCEAYFKPVPITIDDITALEDRMDDLEGDIDAVEATLDAADSAPTQNSEHLVKSGGVYSVLQDVLAKVNELEGVTVRTLSQRAVYRQNYITKTWTMETGGQYSVVATYTVEGAYKVHIKGRSFNSSTHPGTCDYVFKDESGTILGYEEHEGAAEGYDKVVDVPAGATRMAISATNASNTDYPAFCEAYFKKDVRTKTVKPKLMYSVINQNTGLLSGAYYDDRIISTPRHIVLPTKGIFTFKANRDCYARFYFYDKNLEYLGYLGSSDNTGNKPVEGGTVYQIEAWGDAKFMKISLKNDNNNESSIPLTECEIGGIDCDNWSVASANSADGYFRICPRVLVTDPNCCDATTDALQDSATYLPDYGVLALPPKYSPFGEAVRLIIYCHGAAVNYSSSQTRFNQQDLEPDYWLAEGYAVMDIEGNPFDNVNEHFQTPQAMDCYVAAYRLVTELFNIKTDGVFLGGRSMGGVCTFNLIDPACPIPVIAACPNVPGGLPVGTWNYMNADRRRFAALHMGFTGTVPTWTSQSPMTSAEWNYLKDNFVKLRKYSPYWRLIENLPPKSVLMDDQMNGATTEYIWSVYGDLAMKLKVPMKLFSVMDDEIAVEQRAGALIAKMCENGANIFEWRRFESGGHHADTQNPDMRTDVILRDGTEMQNVPVVYVEMLNFWRRFEQGD